MINGIKVQVRKLQDMHNWKYDTIGSMIVMK